MGGPQSGTGIHAAAAASSLEGWRERERERWRGRIRKRQREREKGLERGESEQLHAVKFTHANALTH